MKLLSIFLSAFLVGSLSFAGLQNTSVKILNAATATGAGSVYPYNGPYGTVQCYGTTSSGTGSVAVLVQVSNGASPATGTSVDWITAGTITLGSLATTQTTDGF